MAGLNLKVSVNVLQATRELRGLARDLSKIGAEAKAASAKSAGLGKAFSRINVVLRSSLGLLNRTAAAFAVFGVGGAAFKAIEFTAAFEKNLAEVNTLLDEGTVPISRYRDQLLLLSTQSSKTLDDLTKGLYQTISAGIPAVEGAAGAFSVLEAAQRAAVAGLSTTEESVNALVSVLNAYGNQTTFATDVTDKLFLAVKKGRVVYSDLASGIGRVAPVAAQAGVGLDEILTVLVQLTKAGISPRESITGLRNLLRSIIKPSQQTVQAMDEMNLALAAAGKEQIDFSAESLRQNGLIGVLNNLTRTTGGSSQALSELFPNIRALVPALVTVGDRAEETTQILEEFRRSGGETAEAFEIIDATASETFAKLQSNLGRLAALSFEGILDSLNEQLAQLNEYLSSPALQRDIKGTVEGVKDAILTLAGALDVLVVALQALIFIKIGTFAQSIVKASGGITTALKTASGMVATFFSLLGGSASVGTKFVFTLGVIGNGIVGFLGLVRAGIAGLLGSFPPLAVASVVVFGLYKAFQTLNEFLVEKVANNESLGFFAELAKGIQKVIIYAGELLDVLTLGLFGKGSDFLLGILDTLGLVDASTRDILRAREELDKTGPLGKSFAEDGFDKAIDGTARLRVETARLKEDVARLNEEFEKQTKLLGFSSNTERARFAQERAEGERTDFSRVSTGGEGALQSSADTLDVDIIQEEVSRFVSTLDASTTEGLDRIKPAVDKFFESFRSDAKGSILTLQELFARLKKEIDGTGVKIGDSDKEILAARLSIAAVQERVLEERQDLFDVERRIAELKNDQVSSRELESLELEREKLKLSIENLETQVESIAAIDASNSKRREEIDLILKRRKESEKSLNVDREKERLARLLERIEKARERQLSRQRKLQEEELNLRKRRIELEAEGQKLTINQLNRILSIEKDRLANLDPILSSFNNIVIYQEEAFSINQQYVGTFNNVLDLQNEILQARVKELSFSESIAKVEAEIGKLKSRNKKLSELQGSDAANRDLDRIAREIDASEAALKKLGAAQGLVGEAQVKPVRDLISQVNSQVRSLNSIDLSGVGDELRLAILQSKDALQEITNEARIEFNKMFEERNRAIAQSVRQAVEDLDTFFSTRSKIESDLISRSLDVADFSVPLQDRGAFKDAVSALSSDLNISMEEAARLFTERLKEAAKGFGVELESVASLPRSLQEQVDSFARSRQDSLRLQSQFTERQATAQALQTEIEQLESLVEKTKKAFDEALSIRQKANSADIDDIVKKENILTEARQKREEAEDKYNRAISEQQALRDSELVSQPEVLRSQSDFEEQLRGLTSTLSTLRLEIESSSPGARRRELQSQAQIIQEIIKQVSGLETGQEEQVQGIVERFIAESSDLRGQFQTAFARGVSLDSASRAALKRLADSIDIFPESLARNVVDPLFRLEFDLRSMVLGTIGPVFDAARDALSTYGRSVANSVGLAIDSLTGSISSFFADASFIITSPLDAAADAYNGLISGLSSLFDARTWSSAVRSASSGFSELIDPNTWSNIWEDGVDSFNEFADNFESKTRSAFEDGGRYFSDQLDFAFNKSILAFELAFDAIVATITAVLDRVLGSISRAIQAPIDMLFGALDAGLGALEPDDPQDVRREEFEAQRDAEKRRRELLKKEEEATKKRAKAEEDAADRAEKAARDEQQRFVAILETVKSLKDVGASNEEIARAQSEFEREKINLERRREDDLEDRLEREEKERDSVFEDLRTPIQKLNDIVDRALDFAISLAENIGPIFEAFLTRLIEAIPVIIPALTVAIVSSLSVLAEKLPELINVLVTELLNAIPLIIDAIINLLAPLTLALVEGFTLIIRDLPDIIIGLIDGLIEAIPDIVDSLVESLPELITALVRATPEIIGALVLLAPLIITALIKESPRLAAAIIREIPSIIAQFTIGVVAGVTRAFGDAGRILSNILSAFMDIPEVFDATGTALKVAGEATGSFLASSGRVVGGYFMDAARFVARQFEYAVGFLRQAANYIFEQVVSAFNYVTDIVVSGFDFAIDAIVFGLELLLFPFIESFNLLVAGLDYLVGAFNSIGSVFSSIGNAFDSIYQSFLGLIDRIGNFLSGGSFGKSVGRSIKKGARAVAGLFGFHTGGNIEEGHRNSDLASAWRNAGVQGYLDGGMVTDRVFSSMRASMSDDVPALLQVGEAVLNRSAVSAIGGSDVVDAINSGNVGSGDVNLNVAINPNASGLGSVVAALLPMLIESISVSSNKSQPKKMNIAGSSGRPAGYRSVPGVY